MKWQIIIKRIYNELNERDNKSLNTHINAGIMFHHYRQLFKRMNKNQAENQLKIMVKRFCKNM